MTAISITEVTEGSIEGTGSFDKIMSAMQIRLEEEFSQGRITGDDYANVYLGAMTASMQQAVAFVLGKQTADAQAELTRAQTCNIVVEKLNIPKQGALIDSQTTNTLKQVEIASAEIAIKTQQELEAIENVDIARAKLANIPKEGLLLDAQITQTTKQGLLVDEQKAEVTAQTVGIDADNLNKPKQGDLLDEQVVLAKADTINKVKEGTVLDRQADKILAEKLLLSHKAITEQAQYGDNVTDIVGATVVVAGVVGKQKLLYKAQTDGFSRDAEQKLAKIMADTWNIRRSTDSTLTTVNTGLDDTNIKSVLDKARSGIGAA
jgi:hypothetical protein